MSSEHPTPPDRPSALSAVVELRSRVDVLERRLDVLEREVLARLDGLEAAFRGVQAREERQERVLLEHTGLLRAIALKVGASSPGLASP